MEGIEKPYRGCGRWPERARLACRYDPCDVRPVIFGPALKYLHRFVRDNGVNEPLAYHDDHWTRRNAPLLDHMGAVIDHLEAHSRGGPDRLANLVTACNKCNARKSDGQPRELRRPIKGKYGEPEHWDGLSTLFVILVDEKKASPTERDWLKHLRAPTTHDREDQR
jgi:5-methylcytosine-specific restriction endonuclease McrA